MAATRGKEQPAEIILVIMTMALLIITIMTIIVLKQSFAMTVMVGVSGGVWAHIRGVEARGVGEHLPQLIVRRLVRLAHRLRPETKCVDQRHTFNLWGDHTQRLSVITTTV
eukprot:COSAG04_NODE_881_length_9663_cov_30.524258_2_plen_111_part_00